MDRPTDSRIQLVEPARREGQETSDCPALEKALATVQIDLDGLWVLLQFLGYQIDEEATDSLFETGVLRILDALSEYHIRATFFVNAVDLQHGETRGWIERIADAGHELANHGFDHTYFSRMSREEKARQITQSTAMFREAFGESPRGFRAPGYDFDREGLRLLEEAGYLYDSSVLPTSIGLALQWSQRLLTGRSRISYPWREQLCAPDTAYRPARGDLYRRGHAGILELPVTVVPWCRFPLSFSYGALLGSWYFRWGLGWALQSGRTVNFLFHLVDFADPIRDARLRKVPGLGVPLSKRLALIHDVLRFLSGRARVLSSAQLCERLRASEAMA